MHDLRGTMQNQPPILGLVGSTSGHILKDVQQQPASDHLNQGRPGKTTNEYMMPRRSIELQVLPACGGMRYQFKWQDVPRWLPLDNQQNLEATIRRL